MVWLVISCHQFHFSLPSWSGAFQENPAGDRDTASFETRGMYDCKEWDPLGRPICFLWDGGVGEDRGPSVVMVNGMRLGVMANVCSPFFFGGTYIGTKENHEVTIRLVLVFTNDSVVGLCSCSQVCGHLPEGCCSLDLQAMARPCW